MKTIFDKAVRDELIQRIDSLGKYNEARWGQMNVWQMTKHCCIWDSWVLGKNKPIYRQAFAGKLFGKMVLKSMTKDDRPVRKNMSTIKDFIVKKKDGDVEHQKKIWLSLISDYENYSNPDFIHSFFGKMTIEQIGIIAYKHADHHLRQFGA